MVMLRSIPACRSQAAGKTQHTKLHRSSPWYSSICSILERRLLISGSSAAILDTLQNYRFRCFVDMSSHQNGETKLNHDTMRP
jgi:hypothetical protein